MIPVRMSPDAVGFPLSQAAMRAGRLVDFIA
jgi:hypothetical protein